MGPIGLIGLMGLMGLGLMGCSGDSPEPAPEPAKAETAIAFASGLEEEQAVTRAAMPLSEQAVTRTTPLSEKTQRFTVWGYKNMSYDEDTQAYDSDGSTLQTVFPGYNVGWTSGSSATSTTNSSGWDYVNQLSSTGVEQTIKYWDWSATAYRFFAYAGSGVTEAQDPLGSPTSYKFSFTANAEDEATCPYYSRLWFSNNNYPECPAYGQAVRLEFLKPFVKVRFMFRFADPSQSIVLEEKSFKPTDNSKIHRAGTVTITYPLTGNTTRETVTPSNIVEDKDIVKFAEDYEGDAKTYTETDNGWYTVLPAPNQGSYTLSVTVNGGDPKSAVVPAEFMNWLPGYEYTYIFKITEAGGVEIDLVQAAFTEWGATNDQNTNEHPVYNW